MRSLLYLATFFIVTPITLLTSVFALKVVSAKPPLDPLADIEQTATQVQAPRYGSRVYAAIPDPVGKVAGAATVGDARVEIIRQYLEKYDSPLVPYAEQAVKAAEENELDFRLLVAIAQQESNLCKKIPENSYNCWGWGIHARGTLRFSNYTEAIETVSQGLKENYLNKGYTTPEEIMRKYTPSSPGTWAAGVTQFLSEME
ncbi:MAG: hypothetical protein A2700_00370 [Candidatus Blackburnbacteria bacterium RIFCSPHIGHO2_01_FULL_44_64]|uniref:Mannosyl-glycoprotein endo-beta-N-acetylglucosamidase-like domain-containing protein n=1 Tax=Candidatus Blackburnbacteria bacterium RIFCSPHIGHO2_02_FULL_44_20 TaxID=1797516 RepID=A0A1G1V850_9BACT|nr:MAG: hypothetical protein A2700_00370 [Candidatus Blackburnbacteria bacterium RIFCSPHIGHO2_01_FULL_44_64]OGY10231.1 MAG: hypothetical protein A3E16_03415 [Candidatus Blackburnbacteria bacterium RIFCSPHIGHO2_12_FULL_44_25]OGY11372.1 MAG: hypothetical protein A3D26_02610 [Candidatus Blackburnbacteria bacterium RIFCSPHIGHO2_02_FULL_44_20]OGY13548.1 MAG: hypothetical protein A3A62_01035 [Candidatus Blackburnbacteria bacterium RIFCSPLOWO2_01_FULL_44_43]